MFPSDWFVSKPNHHSLASIQDNDFPDFPERPDFELPNKPERPDFDFPNRPERPDFDFGGEDRLSETDWNHLPIFDQICAFLDQIHYFTKAETLQNTSYTPENLHTKIQKVRIYFGNGKNVTNTVVKL